MDNYAVSDFLDYDPPCKFDLVTLTGGMEYFDADRFFAKLSSILEPGGVFATFNDYFYELHGAAMHLPMEAPWLHARLSKPDLLRYYEEYHPDISAAAKQAVYFPTTHCTVRNFIRIAASHGLEMMLYRRSIGTDALNNFFSWTPSSETIFSTASSPIAGPSTIRSVPMTCLLIT